jgi:L-iditol 2-dehydrogenase
MKAVEANADGSVRVVEREVPPIGPGEALLRTRASGICGSDLLGWYVGGKAGTVLGHEVAGEIVEVGAGVTRFRPGDRVVPHHHAPCLSCDACRTRRFVHCESWKSSRLDPGGLSEFVRIPAGNLETDTRPVPETLSEEEASFTEPLATVVKAFRRAGFGAERSTLIVGLGTAGQLAVRLSRAAGASRVCGVDRVASRLELARLGGADEVLDLREEPAGDPRPLAGRRRYDLVFVCPGRVGAMSTGLDLVAPGGTLLLFTMAPPEEEWTLRPNAIYFREVSIVPSYSCGPEDMREALELLASRRVSAADLVTHRFPIEQAPQAFARAADPEGSMKVVITFE